jgi:hypothetical protein
MQANHFQTLFWTLLLRRIPDEEGSLDKYFCLLLGLDPVAATLSRHHSSESFISRRTVAPHTATMLSR